VDLRSRFSATRTAFVIEYPPFYRPELAPFPFRTLFAPETSGFEFRIASREPL
jgi:hypothetical protein